MSQHPERFLKPTRTLDDLKAHIAYSIANAIWAELENYAGDEWPRGLTPLIEDLYEISINGPKGRIIPEVLNLHHFIQSLSGDVMKALNEITEREEEKAFDRAMDPYPDRLYPEADYN
jgi:hypothetical protein